MPSREVVHVGDAAARQPVEHAFVVQGLERAAVAVGIDEDAVLLAENQPAFPVNGRDHLLPEEADVGRVHPVIPLRLEAGDGLAVRGLAGHDAPGDRHAAASAAGEDLLGVDLEQRALRHRTDRVHTFGVVVAEPRALAAGDHQHADTAGGYQLFAPAPGGPVLLALRAVAGQPHARRGPQLPRELPGRAFAAQQLHPPRKFLPVDRVELVQKCRAPVGREFRPPAQHMPLPDVVQSGCNAFLARLEFAHAPPTPRTSSAGRGPARCPRCATNPPATPAHASCPLCRGSGSWRGD